MGFLNKRQEDDDELPGSGLHVDLASRFCPECRKEALPWQDVCEDCGVAPVAADQLPSSSFPLPSHLLEGLDDDAGAEGAGTEGPGTGTDADAERDTDEER